VLREQRLTIGLEHDMHPQLIPIGRNNIIHAVPLELEPVAEA
jgi:hypothetical protein